MPNLARPFAAVGFAVLAALGAAAHASEEAPEGEAGSPFDARIGWFDKCLAIKNPALEPGTPVTFMIFDPNRTEFVAYGTFTVRVSGRILGKTRSGERCPALNAVYGGVNESPDISFYEVALVGGFVWAPESTWAVGILGLEAEADIIDLNADGAEDSFTVCRNGDGPRFEMWAGEPRKSERLWRGNFHFGRKVSSGNCETGPNLAPELGPFDLRVGYVNECLAIRNGGLEPGTPVTIMTFEGEETLLARRILSLRLTGTILGKTTSDEKCHPLFDNRRGINESEGTSFYAVALDDGPFMNPDDGIFGIGIVGLGIEDAGPIDLDGNGVADSLTACTPFEGTYFRIWTGVPYTGEPLWEDYYYLGYEVEKSDCPFLEPDLSALPPSAWPLDARLGWVHGCLGIFNTRLQPGTPITLLVFGVDGERAAGRSILNRRVEGKILGTTDSAEDCPALAGRGREWNDLYDDGSYYVVALEDGRSLEPTDLGIGIVALGPEEADPINLDGNRAADGFAVCRTKEGLQFVVWEGEPYKSELLWRIPSYLFRQVVEVRDCPETL